MIALTGRLTVSVILYFVNNSIHQIPSFIYTALQTGGKVLTTGADSYREIKEHFPQVDVELCDSEETTRLRAAELNPKVIVHPDFTHKLFAGIQTKHVQVFHGVSDKKYHLSQQVTLYDLNLLAGEKAVNEYRQVGLLPKMRYKVVGYPKLDRVFSGRLDRAAQFAKYGVDPSKPTVLYAPTWNDKLGNTSIPKYGLEVLSEVPDEINLVVKLHPNTLNYDKKYYPQMKSAATSRSNITFIDYAPDIIPVMAMADLMIGDISSVTHEFIAFQRPLVFLDSGFHFFQGKLRTWVWQAGDVVKKKGQVWSTVMERLAHPEAYAAERRQVLAQIFYKPDGHAAERSAQAIREIAGLA